MKLERIIDLDTLQNIQNCFAEATGFAAITVDYKGQPLLEYSCFSPFCSKLREDKFYRDKCCSSDAHGGLESARRGDIYIYKCYAGLVDFAIPIMVEGEYVASMMCGQVLSEDDVIFDVVSEKNDSFKNDQALRELYSKVNVVPSKKIKQTANLMYITLNYIVEQYILNKKNIYLLNKEKEKIELEKQIKELEIKFYHSQVNPHFLFNALNIASRQAYLEDAKKTQEIIFALADIYRHFLKDSSYLVTIEEEMRNVNNYMFIQRIRFGEGLVFEQDIQEDILKNDIPAMVLQILVENAVRHGLEPKEELGCVKISSDRSDTHIYFYISNDGVKIDGRTLKRLNTIKYNRFQNQEIAGLGVYNVHKRLEYFYADEYELQFKNDRTNVVALLKIPIL